MNYDIWGSWSSTAGPNAPLYDTCLASEYQHGAGYDAVQAWKKAGMPLDKIVLGVASHGHSFGVNTKSAFPDNSSTLAMYPTFNSSNHPVGDSWDDAGGIDICGVNQSSGGIINFWGLIEAGFLTEEGVAADGISYAYGDCDRTVSLCSIHTCRMYSG